MRDEAPRGWSLATLLPGWPAAVLPEWSRAVADSLETALRWGDATGHYAARLGGLLVGGAPGLAVVAGARGEVAQAICTRLAAGGRRVLHLAPDQPQPGAWQGIGVAAITLDTGDEAACNAAATRIAGEAAPVEVLVHLVDTGDGGADDVHRCLAGIGNLSRPLVEVMSERGHGRIVFVCLAPRATHERSHAGCSAHKAGVLAFSRGLAQAVAARGITVNVVSAGYVAADDGIDAPARDALIERIPARRLAAAMEIAHVTAFLADAGSGYITGADIPVSGGLRMA